MKYNVKISKGKIIGLSVLAFLVALLAYYSRDNKNSPEYRIQFVKTAPKEYWELFPGDVRKKIVVSTTIIPHLSSPISHFTYDNKKYYIEVFKIDTVGNKSLGSIITLSSIKDLKINGVPYFNMGGLLFDVNYKTGHHKASHINLNLYGNSITTIVRSDTIVGFSSNFKIFSIKYNQSDTSSIWAMAEGKYPNIPDSYLPINIMFIKKQKSVYFLVMSVDNSGILLKHDILYNLILGQR
jgi:hypothetical protein